jgi:hypothetical protein
MNRHARALGATLCAALTWWASPCQPTRAGTAAFTLPQGATTSAGIFDSNGRLLRTLWAGEHRAAGSLTLEWDGRDDSGATVSPTGHYLARLLAHDVRYIWEGVIGNTSSEFVGPHVHRAFHPINDMAIDGSGNAFYVVGYNEQQNAIHRFQTTRPQEKTALAHDDYRRVFRYVATDGTLAYFADVGLMAPVGSPLREPATFVVALKVDDGSEYHFGQGKLETFQGQWNRWESVIDYAHEDIQIGDEFRTAPSGLAVQQRGNALFIAHAHLDEVRVLDKRDGALLNRIEVSNPTSTAIAPDDSFWVVCRVAGRPAVERYRSHGATWLPEIALSSGLQEPVAIGVSPLDGTLVVADAATDQLKAFDDRGRPLWTLGYPGGYRDGRPDVATDRFSFSAGPTYVAFQADGSFWLGDTGNARNLHFSARRKYLGEIMFMPGTYHVAVDLAHPSRVFNRYLEFAVDYSVPLRSSWHLVRNWAAGLKASYVGDLDGFRFVSTLSNGRTYAVAPRYDVKGSELVELTAHGVRSTGITLDLGVKPYLDGSLRSYELRSGEVVVHERKLSGFDANGNPRWDEPVQLAAVQAVGPQDPYYHDVAEVAGVNEPTFPQSSGDVLVFFNPGRSSGFHLGGVRVGGEGWLWRASPSGSWTLDSSGEIESRDGTYELDHGVQYLGNVVVTSGRNIVYGYHGEAWNQGQADQWMHYWDNGLFIGQFGRPVYPARNKVSAASESAGNAFSPQLVVVGGQLYLWHNDEGVHGGVHRWRIDGAARVKTLEAGIEP